MSIDSTLSKPEPSDEKIQQALDSLVTERLDQFPLFLNNARILWRKFRDLVEAPEFPEPYRSAYVKQHGYAPDDAARSGDWKSYVPEDPTAPGFWDALRSEAREIAQRKLIEGR